MVWNVAAPSTTDELLRILDGHVGGETEHIDAYRKLAYEIADPVVSVLMDLVIEDEERHHDLLHRMASRLRNDLEATKSADALPYASRAPDGGQGLAAVVEGYARDETTSAREMRRLAKDARSLYGGLLGLLLDTMADDSEKHERILRFVLKRLEALSSTGPEGP
jgi:rubrerythrin